MQLRVSSYIPGDSPVHACDARVKIVLLAAYSVTLFLADTWAGLAVCAVLFAAAVAASGIRLGRFLGVIVPVYVLAAFTVVFNGFALDASQAAVTGAMPGAPAPALAPGLPSLAAAAGLQPAALIGAFGIVPAGFERGCFFAVRIILLVAASLIVTYTATSTQLTDALASFMRPLRRLRVPVDDVAMVFSLALRFIPVTAEELGRVHDAQAARGAAFDTGSVWGRLRAWQTVLIPLFVGLFRRADALACAMDARCYGAPGAVRTSLSQQRIGAKGAGALVAGLAVCALLAVFL